MMPKRTPARIAIGLFMVLVGGALLLALPAAQGGGAPSYRVDPFWPKPMPVVTGADGLERQWVTGMVGASCIDSRDPDRHGQSGLPCRTACWVRRATSRFRRRPWSSTTGKVTWRTVGVIRR